MASEDESLDLTRVAGFANSLSLAIDDFTLEQIRGARFYFDADVAVWPILGFRQLDFYRREMRPGTQLVRSLLSAGFLGDAYILRPHALELDGLIRKQPEFKTKQSRSHFRESVSRFLRRQGLYNFVERLKEIQVSDRDEEWKLDAVLGELREAGAAAFIALELAHGSWQERLKRFSASVLRFDPEPPPLKAILGEADFWSLNGLLSKRRGPRFSHSNFNDIASLLILHRKLRAGERDSGLPLVRFYTDTAALEELWREEELVRSLLEYREEVGCGKGESRFIVRNTEYFLLRASFSALGFPGVELRQRPAVTLSELERVAAELTQALLHPTEEAVQRAARIEIGDRKLKAVLDELESLSFVDSILLDYHPPEALKDLVRGLRDVWVFADDEDTALRLEKNIRREVALLQAQLRNEARHLRHWYELFEDLKTVTEKLSNEEQLDQLPEARRDLGLVRWGSYLDSASEGRLVELLSGLVSGEEQERWATCGATASAVLDIGSREDCLVLASIFWLLRLYETVVKVINRWDNVSGDNLCTDLVLFRTAARLRAGEPFSLREKEQHMEGLERELKAAQGSLRGEYLLGMGYIAYYVALSEGLTFNSPERMSDEARRWIVKSFAYGEEAVRLSERGSLARAFAINHCAYVGLTTRVNEEKGREYLEDLEDLYGKRDIWNYRFADTLAMTLFKEARELWQNDAEDTHRLGRKEEGGDDVPINDICRLVDEGISLLESSKPYFFDPEIPQHLRSMRRFRASLGCTESPAT